jgi:hypothetical protein
MQSTRNTLMDTYEYVMYGRIFKFMDAGGGGGGSQVLPGLSSSYHSVHLYDTPGPFAA